MAPRTVSVVNMKGGVGKSTTVASLAETLASEGLRVLVIDLDPQSNVSMMLAGQDRWVELRQANRTIDEYFNQYVYGGEPRFFREFVANRVSDIAGEPALDLRRGDALFDRLIDRLQIMAVRHLDDVPAQNRERLERGLH